MARPSRKTQNLEKLIRELEVEAQKTRLEAMRLAASLLTKMDEALATISVEAVNPADDLAVLQLRHASVMRKAEDLQAKIDRLQADKYDQAHRY